MYSNWLNVSAGGTGNNKTNSLVILELMPADSASTMIRPSVESGHNCYLIAGSYFNPQILYAGLNGEVIKSNDGGLNWETNSLVADSTIFTSIVLNPQDPRQMLAGGKDRNNLFVLYKSNDKGLSWKPLTSGTYRNCLARCLISGINTMTGEVINDESIILIGTDGDGIFKYPASISPVNVEIENKSINISSTRIILIRLIHQQK